MSENNERETKLKKTPLDWAINPILQKQFPNYEDYLLWAEEFEQKIQDIEEYLSKPNAKTIKVVTRDIHTGKEIERWFSKKEYEKWKIHGDNRDPNVRCKDCRHLSGLLCRSVNKKIPCNPDELVVCDFFSPLDPI